MADIVIEGSALSETYERANRGGIFWTTALIGYVIYLDSGNDLCYRKTLDGGGNWGDKVEMVAGAIYAYDSWADWQTLGDSGTVIHMAYIDSLTQDIRYISLDTDGDSVGSPDVIEACQGSGTMAASTYRSLATISITKARGGNIGVAFHYQDNAAGHFYEFYTSPDGTTWTNRANPWEINLDHLLLFPGNEADTQDLWAIYWDASVNAVSLKTYDNSGNSWSEQAFETAADTASYLQMDGAIRLSDGHLILAVWNLYDNAVAHLAVWDINGAGSITQKTHVLTNSDNSFLASVFINQNTDDIYVAYARGGTIEATVTIYYKKSDDGGGSWGGETAMQANAADDERWISCGAMKAAWGGKFLPVWFNDDINDLFCNTDNGISIAAAGAALEKSLSDSVAITDSLLKAIGLNKGDTVIIADSEAKTIGLVKAEAVAIVDSIAKEIRLTKSDVLAIADSFARTVTYLLSLTDTVTITDSISKAVSIVKADTMAITDAIVVGIGYALHIALSDIVTITDRLVGELRTKAYLKQSISRMEVKGMDIARMSIKRMNIDKMPLYRWITRRWTA